MTIEERLNDLENKFAAMSVAQRAAGDPSGYYTSIYSGEQIDDAIGGVLEGNIPNLSGSTIPVSPSDQTSIAAALSKKADATPPQEYDLPLAEGWKERGGDSCRYAKTQENMCVVTFKAIPNTANQGGDTKFATLPAGFHPSALVHGVCTRTDFSNDGIALWVNTDGTLHINAPGGMPDGVGVMGSVVFVAAN